MLKEVKLYTIICDGCGKDASEGTDYTASNEPWDMFCQDDLWHEENHCHFCPDCYEYDDNDELIIKNKSK